MKLNGNRIVTLQQRIQVSTSNYRKTLLNFLTDWSVDQSHKAISNETKIIITLLHRAPAQLMELNVNKLIHQFHQKYTNIVIYYYL